MRADGLQASFERLGDIGEAPLLLVDDRKIDPELGARGRKTDGFAVGGDAGFEILAATRRDRKQAVVLSFGRRAAHQLFEVFTRKRGLFEVEPDQAAVDAGDH